MHKGDVWRLDYIGRVEGEGGLDLVLSHGMVEEARLRIFEPPRFFEGFLEGRKYNEIMDITARICGICPISYQMAAANAIESAFGFKASEQTKRLRRLFSWAEILQSHALHIYMLAAPDYLGIDGIGQLAEKFPQLIERGLRLKRTVGDLGRTIGGREVHPVVPRVGGFYDVPTGKEFASLHVSFEKAREDAIETIKTAAQFTLPEMDRDSDYLCLSHPDHYALNDGNVKTLKGLEFPVDKFLDHINEQQVPESNALQCRLKLSGSYTTGPLARVNINFKHLSESTKEILAAAGFSFPSQNPFHAIIARGAEMLTGIEECLELMDGFSPEPEGDPEIEPRASEGFGISEAPRGSLFHHYIFDENGMVKHARLIPPTAQNLARIEDDLMMFAQRLLDKSHEELSLGCEKLIRSYDPCISCATHFLKVRVREK
jgi:sulfhydrogenase subunit alpha